MENLIKDRMIDAPSSISSENYPDSYLLQQNFPNPFNPSTKIQYAVGSRQLVLLKVYDALGRDVVTLVNEEKPAGTYEVEFSAEGGSASGGNAHNSPSGVYFYQLSVSAWPSQDGKAGSFVETKKMILIR
jgi:hypothetical protein